MDYKKLAQLLFPDVKEGPEDLEKKYPERNLPEGAKVTRFAPSPTGYVHLGGLYQMLINERLAHLSGGIAFLRIEDTDSKREIPGAAGLIIKTVAPYGIVFDEGATTDENGKITDKGDYGPYLQSKRKSIYHVFAKKLVEEGKAYPCFTTEEELKALNAADKKSNLKNKVWKEDALLQKKREMLSRREITLEKAEEELKKGHPFVLRIKSDGDGVKRVIFNDLVKGPLEIPENDEDFVLLKSDGIPTYHFAHAVDDHLMRTTHVIRSEEWLPSAAKHMQLFRYLGFKMPKYLHTAQIMRIDEKGNRKKLSKRDMGFKMEDYSKLGYAPECVIEYLMTILNSNYEEWHAANKDKSYEDFPFSIKKMSVSGCLFDFNKLNDVSKNLLSLMTAEKIYEGILSWASTYDKPFAATLSENPGYAKSILSIGRGTSKPRKDLTAYSDAKNYMSIFYDSLFKKETGYPEGHDLKDVKKALKLFLGSYREEDDNSVWFEKIKDISEKIGYAREIKLYKQAPEEYKGHVGDVSMFIRIAVTGRTNSPDMYEVMKILGSKNVISRIEKELSALEEV